MTLPLIMSFVSILICHHLFSFIFKLYKKVWEYASTGELLIIFKVASYSIVSGVIIQLFLIQTIYFKVVSVTWLLHLFFIGGSRLVWRLYRDAIVNQPAEKVKTLIIGAGSAGTMVARQLLKRNSTLHPVGFIDDNPSKHQLDILGIPVRGGVKDIVQVVDDLQVGNIIIAIPSLSKRELNVIFTECAKTNTQTKILPFLEDIITGKLSVSQFRDVQVEDLLGRDPVDMDISSIAKTITDQVVLVTGAGGSIGSEITRQISEFNPRKLILLGHGENSIYKIHMELQELNQATEIELITEIADIKDEVRMLDIMMWHKPDVVYHAAAHKHVPLMENHPEEAVKNNMLGTLNVARASHLNQVGTFVMVSTDKAVNPTSVMGATKKLAEMVVQHMDQGSETKFVAVRFGNVLGSRGSVIPLFKKQIEQGGPITVTHPDMIRYFMTIPEASRLVIQAGALAKGGEIFVLDMGDPVKIVDLAKNLIKLSGFTIDEIGIKYTGMRPGEKLYEELLSKHEIYEEQLYPKIYIGKKTDMRFSDIEEIIMTYAHLDRATLRKQLLYLANYGMLEQPKTAVSI